MRKKVISCMLMFSILAVKLYSVYAINLEKVTLVKFNDPVKFLRYNGKDVGYSMVGHTLNGVNYPAYCIEPSKPGVYEKDSYDVSIKGNVTDNKIIKIIQNGYPYKTPSELGVNTQQEAYYATKCALWCYVNGRKIEDYTSISSEYDYILSATKRIYTTGIRR